VRFTGNQPPYNTSGLCQHQPRQSETPRQNQSQQRQFSPVWRRRSELLLRVVATYTQIVLKLSEFLPKQLQHGVENFAAKTGA
jgi:hypothetical protein